MPDIPELRAALRWGVGDNGVLEGRRVSAPGRCGGGAPVRREVRGDGGGRAGGDRGLGELVELIGRDDELFGPYRQSVRAERAEFEPDERVAVVVAELQCAQLSGAGAGEGGGDKVGDRAGAGVDGLMPGLVLTRSRRYRRGVVAGSVSGGGDGGKAGVPAGAGVAAARDAESDLGAGAAVRVILAGAGELDHRLLAAIPAGVRG